MNRWWMGEKGGRERRGNRDVDVDVDVGEGAIVYTCFDRWLKSLL